MFWKIIKLENLVILSLSHVATYMYACSGLWKRFQFHSSHANFHMYSASIVLYVKYMYIMRREKKTTTGLYRYVYTGYICNKQSQAHLRFSLGPPAYCRLAALSAAWTPAAFLWHHLLGGGLDHLLSYCGGGFAWIQVTTSFYPSCSVSRPGKIFQLKSSKFCHLTLPNST